MEQAREAYELFGEQWKQDGDDGRSESFRALPFGMFMPHTGDGHAFFGRQPKPKHSFEVNEDGQIEVRIRKGDSELVRLYEDADDLADRNPKLFEKYQELMELDEDE